MSKKTHFPDMDLIEPFPNMTCKQWAGDTCLVPQHLWEWRRKDQVFKANLSYTESETSLGYLRLSFKPNLKGDW